MVSIDSNTIDLIGLSEESFVLGKNYFVDSKLQNFTQFKKYIWDLEIRESFVAIGSSIYTTLENAFKNNTTVNFDLDLSYHNRGVVVCKVFELPKITYHLKQGFRVIRVRLIED